MINRYYNDVIEQVYKRLGKHERNIVMACYSNDFSIRDLENIKKYSKNTDKVYFAWHEYTYDNYAGAYEPFLDVICDMYRKYVKGDFSEFLEECRVYYLLQCIFESYYKTGVCIREENIILNEVEYEQKQMTQAIATMLKKLAMVRPIVIVINRFHMAGQSTMELVRLLFDEPTENIGLILGANDVKFRQEVKKGIWNSIIESLEDNGLKYRIGSTGKRRAEEIEERQITEDLEQKLMQVQNTVTLLDFEQANRFFRRVERQIKFEDISIADDVKMEVYLLYAKVSIWRGEMSKALELIEDLMHLKIQDSKHYLDYECAFLLATCNMYQGKLENAAFYAKMARDEAAAHGTEFDVFRAELLMAQTQMSGWYNIFFCLRDIPIDEQLIEKLKTYNYLNHLAHIYIYAYDNSAKVIEQASKSEGGLEHFSEGIAIAKKIGNTQLVYSAYQKNIMMAASNGMYEIALLFTVRQTQFMRMLGTLMDGRMLSGIGYNLSAIGKTGEALLYYDRAIELFYYKRLPEEIAEVYYNRALNHIVTGNYVKAEQDLQMVMKVIQNLHLNSLRVCNLSKLYGLLALACILQEDRFNCERHLVSCRQFLNYIFAKEKENKNSDMIYDYAKCDDDMFLYLFSMALLKVVEKDYKEAEIFFENANEFLLKAEGNQFFSYILFREKRMAFYEMRGMMEQYRSEKKLYEERMASYKERAQAFSTDILRDVEIKEFGACRISDNEIEMLIKQEGLAKDYATNKRHMDFIATWQKVIDVTDVDVKKMTGSALKTFQNHFSLDRALYIWYEEKQPNILYDNTKIELNRKILQKFEHSLRDYPQGFVVSKISDDFFEHQDIISYFGMDDVCSFAAVPFYKNNRLSSLLITYVRMKDNWHSSIDRYMLDENDLYIYQLLFRELSYSINRLEAGNKVREANRKLQAAAVTDVLTGIYNRAGLFEEIHNRTKAVTYKKSGHTAAIMFIDLDNFKPYNDTYGHDVGDIILREMAAIFQRATAENGIVCRYGGDEFVIVMETDDREFLTGVAKQIYKEIEESNGFQRKIEKYLKEQIHIDEKHKITCSIGIATASCLHREEEFEELIKRADDLLYTVKKSEKGHFAFL